MNRDEDTDEGDDQWGDETDFEESSHAHRWDDEFPIAQDETVVTLLEKLIALDDPPPRDDAENSAVDEADALRPIDRGLKALRTDLRCAGDNIFKFDVAGAIGSRLADFESGRLLRFSNQCETCLAHRDRRATLPSRYLLAVIHLHVAEDFAGRGLSGEAWEELCRSHYWYGRLNTAVYSYRSCLSAERSEIASKGGRTRAQALQSLDDAIIKALVTKAPKIGWKNMRDAQIAMTDDLHTELMEGVENADTVFDLASKIYRRICNVEAVREVYDANSRRGRRPKPYLRFGDPKEG